jgi:hypothetical protein
MDEMSGDYQAKKAEPRFNAILTQSTGFGSIGRLPVSRNRWRLSKFGSESRYLRT